MFPVSSYFNLTDFYTRVERESVSFRPSSETYDTVVRGPSYYHDVSRLPMSTVGPPEIMSSSSTDPPLPTRDSYGRTRRRTPEVQWIELVNSDLTGYTVEDFLA